MGTCEQDAKKTKTCPIINSLKRKLGVISGDISHTDLIKKVETLITKNEKLKEDNKKLQDTNNDLTKKVESLITKNEKLKEDNKKLQDTNNDLTKKVESLITEDKKLKNDNKKLQDIIDNQNDSDKSFEEKKFKKIHNKGASEEVSAYSRNFRFNVNESGAVTLLDGMGKTIGTFVPDEKNPLFGKTSSHLNGGVMPFAKHGLNMLGALMYESLISNGVLVKGTSTQ